MTAILAFLLTLPLGIAAAAWGRRLGFLDRPEVRKSHRVPVPRTGGWALLVGGGMAAAVQGAAPLAYAVPAALFFGVGLLDDAGRLGKCGKLLLQLGVTAVAVGMGLGLAGGWGTLATVLWIVAVLEVVNFLDGIDLITCAVSAVVLAGAAATGLGPERGGLYAALAGATIAIAIWNAPPARAFLGDAGTHLLGFLVASTALETDRTRAWPLAVIGVALLPAAVDIAWGMLSKRRLGMGWTDPHRVHLYQRLTRAGWPHGAVALRYGTLTGLGLVLAAHGRTVWFVPVLALHLLDGWRVARRVAPLEREDHRKQEGGHGPEDEHQR